MGNVVRLYLPFSMGIRVNFDPLTYEEEWVHPILHIGSSYSSIKAPIMEWLAENYGTRVQPGFDTEVEDYYIDFPTDADVTWFKLRWLS